MDVSGAMRLCQPPARAPPDTDTQATTYLLNQAGLFLNGQGQPGRAAGYLQRALAGYVRVARRSGRGLRGWS